MEIIHRFNPLIQIALVHVVIDRLRVLGSSRRCRFCQLLVQQLQLFPRSDMCSLSFTFRLPKQSGRIGSPPVIKDD